MNGGLLAAIVGAALVVLFVFTCVRDAEAHSNGWASHSTYAAGGVPKADTFRECEQRRRGVHRCKHKVYWDQKYAELSSSDKRWLYLLRDCESTDGADEHSPGGMYHGRYQFSLATARSAGFLYRRGRSGYRRTFDPHRAYNHEEDVRTVRWRNRAGSGQWPHCAPW